MTKDEIEEYEKRSRFHKVEPKSGPVYKVVDNETGEVFGVGDQGSDKHCLRVVFLRLDGRVFWYSHEGMKEITDKVTVKLF